MSYLNTRDHRAAMREAEGLLYGALPALMQAAIHVALGGNATLLGQLLARGLGAPRTKADMDEVAIRVAAFEELTRRWTANPEQYDREMVDFLIERLGEVRDGEEDDDELDA